MLKLALLCNHHHAVPCHAMPCHAVLCACCHAPPPPPTVCSPVARRRCSLLSGLMAELEALVGPPVAAAETLDGKLGGVEEVEEGGPVLGGKLGGVDEAEEEEPALVVAGGLRPEPGVPQGAALVQVGWEGGWDGGMEAGWVGGRVGGPSEPQGRCSKGEGGGGGRGILGKMGGRRPSPLT